MFTHDLPRRSPRDLPSPLNLASESNHGPDHHWGLFCDWGRDVWDKSEKGPDVCRSPSVPQPLPVPSFQAPSPLDSLVAAPEGVTGGSHKGRCRGWSSSAPLVASCGCAQAVNIHQGPQMVLRTLSRKTVTLQAHFYKGPKVPLLTAARAQGHRVPCAQPHKLHREGSSSAQRSGRFPP